MSEAYPNNKVILVIDEAETLGLVEDYCSIVSNPVDYHIEDFKPKRRRRGQRKGTRPWE